MTGARKAPASPAAATGQPIIHAARTNMAPDRLSTAMAMEWCRRARAVGAAFATTEIVTGGEDSSDHLWWRNHRTLRFLVHRLRCHLRAEWLARGEKRGRWRKILMELQEVRRATLTVGRGDCAAAGQPSDGGGGGIADEAGTLAAAGRGSRGSLLLEGGVLCACLRLFKNGLRAVQRVFKEISALVGGVGFDRSGSHGAVRQHQEETACEKEDSNIFHRA